MNGINLGRVLAGGFVAGILLGIGETVLNQIVLADAWASLAGDPAEATYAIWQSVAMISISILYGVVLIWIYAAIRPRFGPGPVTAIYSGLVLWVIAWGLMGASLSLAGMIPPRIGWISALWGVVEVPAAALAGAWIYREDAAGTGRKVET